MNKHNSTSHICTITKYPVIPILFTSVYTVLANNLQKSLTMKKMVTPKNNLSKLFFPDNIMFNTIPKI